MRPIDRGYRESQSVSARAEDSSIIAPAADPNQRTTRAFSPAHQLLLRPEEFHNNGGEKRQYFEFDGSPALQASSPAGHRFEKRPRHKTRGDRYDAVKLDGDDRGKRAKDKKSHGVEVKRAKRKRQGNMTSAREVMGSFNSESILNGRITVSARPEPFIRCFELTAWNVKDAAVLETWLV